MHGAIPTAPHTPSRHNAQLNTAITLSLGQLMWVI
jgi:hypothetical protein